MLFSYFLPVKMDDFLFENPLLRMQMLEEMQPREWVNEYFEDREQNGEYHRIFPDLL